jgi:hypothetical protein
MDYSIMAVEQGQCEETRLVLSCSSLKIEYFTVAGGKLAYDASLHTPRPLVPVSFRRAVISAINSIAHPGIRATKRLITRRFVWLLMGADISEF